MSLLFDIRNSWGKVMKRGVKLPQRKMFFTDFCHQFTPFRGLFAPTSQSLMSIFSSSLKSLEKSYGKKLSQIVKLSVKKGLKQPRQKKKKKIGKLSSLRIYLYFVFLSSITCHLSPFTCQLSPVNCQLSQNSTSGKTQTLIT